MFPRFTALQCKITCCVPEYCCQSIIFSILYMPTLAVLGLVISNSTSTHQVWFQRDQWQSCLFTRHPGLRGPNQRNVMGPTDRNCAKQYTRKTVSHWIFCILFAKKRLRSADILCRAASISYVIRLARVAEVLNTS